MRKFNYDFVHRETIYFHPAIIVRQQVFLVFLYIFIMIPVHVIKERVVYTMDAPCRIHFDVFYLNYSGDQTALKFQFAMHFFLIKLTQN